MPARHPDIDFHIPEVGMMRVLAGLLLIIAMSTTMTTAADDAAACSASEQQQRIFESALFLKPQLNNNEPPIRSVISSSNDSNVIIWHVATGQRLLPHIHPQGQDTWIVQSGTGDYVVDALGTKKPIKSGDVVVARAGQVHGVTCTSSDEPLVILSVVSPADAGFEAIDIVDTTA